MVSQVSKARPGPPAWITAHRQMRHGCLTALRHCVRRSRAPHVEHEKKTFFSLLKNTRSEDGSQGRAVCARSSERSGDP